MHLVFDGLQSVLFLRLISCLKLLQPRDDRLILKYEPDLKHLCVDIFLVQILLEHGLHAVPQKLLEGKASWCVIVVASQAKSGVNILGNVILKTEIFDSTVLTVPMLVSLVGCPQYPEHTDQIDNNNDDDLSSHLNTHGR